MKYHNKSFDIKGFKAPEMAYASIYGWFWNGPVSKEKTEEQILEMKRLGIRAFYIVAQPKVFRPASIPTRLEPEYLSEEFFEHIKFAIEKARELGMECWIYDEGGWPSGGVCGKLLYEHPECGKRSLGRREVTLKYGEVYKRSSPDVAASFVNDDIMINDGYVAAKDVVIDEYFSEDISWKNPGIPDYPDLTRADSTEHFINMTHEKYKKHLGEYFGNSLTAVFTDEPCAPVLAFNSDLVRLYEEEWGESVLPHLPALHNRVKATGKDITVRRRWYDLVSREFCKNFLKKCKSWSNENKLEFTGHLDCDNTLKGCMDGRNYQIMRGLRCFDIPGVDVIWRQIFPGEKKDYFLNGEYICTFSENKFFPRYASSAARQIGEDVSMTESFGVYGNGLTYEQMRYVIGFQTIRGINKFNPLLVSYDRCGHLMTGELPSFEEKQASHAYLGEFNRYMERLSYVLTRGKRECSVALYYPVNDIWAGESIAQISEEYDSLGFSMERRGIDFDIVDDDVIVSTPDIDRGIISMGKAEYSEIAIPKSAYIPEKTKEMLDRFVKGGGKIHYSAEEISPTVEVFSSGGNILVMKRELDDGRMICLFNQSEKADTVSVEVGKSCGYVIDITNGEILKLVEEDGFCNLNLLSGETVAIYLTDRKLEAKENSEYSDSMLLFNFDIKRVKSFVIGDMDSESIDINEEYIKAELGDWSDRFGADFSGSCIYKTEFQGFDTNVLLELGDVKYVAEPILNGKSLGVKVMPPYNFEIPKKLMKEKNVLEIRVTNTPGNQHHYTKSFDKWRPWQLSPYKTRQDIFDTDTLPSGLFGPVKIKY